ncbi:MAG: gluconeogenesis factor YvcK family protein [Bacillota bacterium]
MNSFKWLLPGMGIKRWLSLSVTGFVISLAGAVLWAGAAAPGLRQAADAWSETLPGADLAWLAGAGLFLAGLVLMVWGLRRGFGSLVNALLPEDEHRVVDMVYFRRYLQRGPKVVVVGGGTGLPVLLRGLKEYTSNLTAVVTVADDGGSSGRLRGDLGMLPPGDIRNCLVALADTEPLMEELLQYRFRKGELAGHNMGNLLLAALNETAGGFDRAVRSLSKVLAIRGQVLPATLAHVQLCAELADGSVVKGESSIPASKRPIKRVFLEPARCFPPEEALLAIREADAVILGPGSLYTSILPNLLVQGLAGAINDTPALKIYICNIMTQPGETDGYTASDHLKAILDHGGPLPDYMVVNREEIPFWVSARYRREGAALVAVDEDELKAMGVKLLAGRLVQDGNVVRHHPRRLARLLMYQIMQAAENGQKHRQDKEDLVQEGF